MQTAEIQDVMFKQEDKVITEDENGEPTAIPVLVNTIFV